MVEFYNAINTFVGNSVFLLVSFLGALIGSGLTGYVLETGKNAAVKKDLAKMADIVEEVKNKYNLLIEDVRSRNSLKMAAIDKRLKVHQEAYTYWNEIISSYKNELLLNSILEQAQSHYNLNCLYLDATVSNKYHEMLYWASHYHDIVIECREGDELALKQKEDFLALLKSIGNLIRSAVSLPSINEDQIRLSD